MTELFNPMPAEAVSGETLTDGVMQIQLQPLLGRTLKAVYNLKENSIEVVFDQCKHIDEDMAISIHTQYELPCDNMIRLSYNEEDNDLYVSAYSGLELPKERDAISEIACGPLCCAYEIIAADEGAKFRHQLTKGE